MRIKVKGILSYPHLFQARAANKASDPKFSTALLIRKDDPQLEELQGQIEIEKANGFPSGFSSKGTLCLKDCDDAFPDKPELSEYYVLNASSKADQRPKVVDANLQDVMDPAEVYGGVEAWVSANIYPYKMDVNKGVACEGVIQRL